MFDVRQTPLAGCVELAPTVHEDRRGRFAKVFHEPTFARLGLETQFAEEYFSVSRQGVLRGMHFQVPPHDHAKLVYLVAGSVLDVVLDLRAGSPSFGRCATFELSADAVTMVYVPRGCAHGFYVRAGPATMVYRTSTVHSPEHDTGVHWKSVGVEWPDGDPVVSERDDRLPALQDFRSPFRHA